MSEVIFTNHLLDRLKDRKISEDLIFKTVRNPNQSKREGDKWELKKRFEKQTVTAIVKYEENKIIVLSAWIFPPSPQTEDDKKRNRYLENKKAGLFKKIWISLLNQLGV